MNYKNLIIKHLAGQTDQNEELQLSQWLAASPRNNEKFVQLQSVWTAAEPPEVKTRPDVQLQWQKLKRSLDTLEHERSRCKRSVFGAALNSRLRPVMVFVALLIVLTAWTIFYNPLQTIYTHNGQTKTVDLPDGSELQLNAGSDISYHKKFTKNRQVVLHGEAFFKVQPDENPFTVITDNSKTTVLGTRFNVWSRNNKTRVTVQKGRVQFGMTNKPETGVVLTAGLSSEIVADNPPGETVNTNIEYYLGWLDNRLMFHKTPLTEIIGELQRYYNVTISTDNINADALTVTGVFDSMPIEQVLSSICLTLDLQYYKTAGVYMIHN